VIMQAMKPYSEDLRLRVVEAIREGMPNRRRFLQSMTGKSSSASAVKLLLNGMGFSQKRNRGGDRTGRIGKSSLEGDSCPRRVDPEQLVFVDEMGTNTYLYSLYAWSKRGERANCSTPRNGGKNPTVLDSMSLKGMGSTLAVEGVTTAAAFEAYYVEDEAASYSICRPTSLT
jgi:hypothetical protein